MNQSHPGTIAPESRYFDIERLSPQAALAAARETRVLIVGQGCLQKTVDVFKEQFPGRRAVVVADSNTMKVAGAAVIETLKQGGIALADTFLYTDPGLYAEYKYVEQLAASLKTHDAIPVAVGSGTINDLVKLSAFQTGRQYMCVGTAASMDGYTAFGASITHEGAKQTFNCPAPQAVVADIDVIRKAPPAMTASGYADLLAKITAGADWLVADALGAEPIDLKAWAIVQGGLRDALKAPADARAGDAAAIHALTEGLMLGGFAMQWAKSSRPASGAEHQFSHLWDMEHHTHNGAAPSHGFKVGVATLTVTAFYETLLRNDAALLDIGSLCAQWPSPDAAESDIRTLFAGSGFVETAIRETRAKHVTAAQLRDQLELLQARWPSMRATLARQLIPFAEVKSRLAAAGAPVEPEEIGISRRRLRDSFMKAYHIRRRFTVLDLAVRAGWLPSALDSLFGPGGMWEI